MSKVKVVARKELGLGLTYQTGHVWQAKKKKLSSP